MHNTSSILERYSIQSNRQERQPSFLIAIAADVMGEVLIDSYSMHLSSIIRIDSCIVLKLCGTDLRD